MQEATSTSTSSCGQRNGAKPSGVGMGCQGHPGSILGQSQVRGHLGHSHPLQGGDSWEVGKKANIQSYRVVSTTGHISHNHIWDWQNLPIFRLLDEDGHSPGHQLAVVLYPLCPGNELPVRVVSCGDQSQWSAVAVAAAQSTIHWASAPTWLLGPQQDTFVNHASLPQPEAQPN